MPEKGIKRLLGDKLPDPETSNGISRAELYLSVDDVAYSLDLDGHVLAFAKKSM